MKKFNLTILGIAMFSILIIAGMLLSNYPDLYVLQSQVTLQNENIRDQDDMCIWYNSNHPDQSTIITSDKAAQKLFVYDLSGSTIADIAVAGQPGNIDIRYNFPFAGDSIDIIGFNDRTNEAITFYKVNRTNGTPGLIGSLDAGKWPKEVYGFCLYHNPVSGKYYAFGVGKSGQVKQWEIMEEAGQLKGIEKRIWKLGSQTEGCVADDETGKVYFAEEDRGIWKFDAEPGAGTKGELIAEVDGKTLSADLEGLTIYYGVGEHGYIIVSSQGSDSYAVFDRVPPHSYLFSFRVEGVTGTDGIDVLKLNLGSRFPMGIFTAHNDTPHHKTVEVCSLQGLGL